MKPLLSWSSVAIRVLSWPPCVLQALAQGGTCGGPPTWSQEWGRQEKGSVGHFCCSLLVGYHLQVKSSKSTGSGGGALPHLFPKANFAFADTKAGLCPCLGRARCGPGLALCAPGSRSRRWAGGVAAQCQHCLWPRRLPWGDRQGVLACPPCCSSGSPAPLEPGTAWGHRPAVLILSVPSGPLAPAGSCPLAVPLLRAERRVHPKRSCLDGVGPTSAFAICTAAMWVRERSLGYIPIPAGF